jgi:uncharacterized membrane protein YfcA
MPEVFLPEGMSAAVLAVLLATSFAASFITVAFGIGGGAVLLAVFATLLPPLALIPVHGVVQIGSNFGRVLLLVRHIHWPALGAFTVGSVIGAGLGGALVVNLDPAWVQVTVGGFIVWSVLASPPALLRNWGGLTGAISSFLTMFFGATGLFVASFTKSHNLERHAHVATHATLMTVQHGLKTVAFGLLGFGFGPWLAFVGLMIGAGVLGTVLGRQVLTRITDQRFRLALNAILLLLSARLIWAGLRDLTT